MDNSADIDIDVPDRSAVMSRIQCWPAAQRDPQGQLRRHGSGVYFTPVPYDALLGHASQDYQELEARGYFKLDLLNQSVYQLVRDPDHYQAMLDREPPWARLQEQAFVEQITQINAHYRTLQSMPEPVDTIARMAMFIAVIRPGKRHLTGRSWKEVAREVWDRSVDGYTFRQSHAVAYAHLVALHMNLLDTGAVLVDPAHQGNAAPLAAPADLT